MSPTRPTAGYGLWLWQAVRRRPLRACLVASTLTRHRWFLGRAGPRLLGRLMRVRILLLATACIAWPAAAQEPPRPYPPWPSHRFNEDWSFLRDTARRADAFDAVKFIPLDPDGARWMTLGGELRERLESYQNRTFGLTGPRDAPRGNTYLLQRLLLHADLQLDPAFRAFLQFGSLRAYGAKGGTLAPTQDDHADLVQAFGDLRARVAPDTLLTLRGGRQELGFGSERLVGPREGPNLRRAFDGGRATLAIGTTRLDAFITRPVEPATRRFDRTDPGEAFWGAYLDASLPGGGPLRLRANLYYLGYERDGAMFAQGQAFERRHTVGTRLVGTAASVDLDWEAAYQVGRFGDAAIGAWTVATDTGITLPGLPWRPRIGLKADIASGDADRQDRRLGTFNALYPKLPYFTEAGFVAPANLIDVFPSVRVRPAPGVTAELGWDVLWRHRTADAFYRAAPFTPLPRTAGQRDPFIGSQVQLALMWNLGRHVALRADYVHFFAGPTITRAGGRDADFFTTSVAFRF